MVYIFSFTVSNFLIFLQLISKVLNYNLWNFQLWKIVKSREILKLKMLIPLGERDANKSFNAAYTVALKPHHGWIVQQAFYVGLKMVPDFNGFLDSMTGAGFEGDKVKSSYFQFTRLPLE